MKKVIFENWEEQGIIEKVLVKGQKYKLLADKVTVTNIELEGITVLELPDSVPFSKVHGLIKQAGIWGRYLNILAPEYDEEEDKMDWLPLSASSRIQPPSIDLLDIIPIDLTSIENRFNERIIEMAEAINSKRL